MSTLEHWVLAEVVVLVQAVHLSPCFVHSNVGAVAVPSVPNASEEEIGVFRFGSCVGEEGRLTAFLLRTSTLFDRFKSLILLFKLTYLRD